MESDAFNRLIGEVLRQLRTANRMTQGELAQRTGVSRASIANMETGRQAMSAYQAFQIASAFDLPSVEHLFPPLVKPGEGESIEFYRAPELSESQREQLKALIAPFTGR